MRPWYFPPQAMSCASQEFFEASGIYKFIGRQIESREPLENGVRYRWLAFSLHIQHALLPRLRLEALDMFATMDCHLFLPRHRPSNGMCDLRSIHPPGNGPIFEIFKRCQPAERPAVIKGPMPNTARLVHDYGLRCSLGGRCNRLRALGKTAPDVSSRSLAAIVQLRFIATFQWHVSPISRLRSGMASHQAKDLLAPQRRRDRRHDNAGAEGAAPSPPASCRTGAPSAWLPGRDESWSETKPQRAYRLSSSSPAAFILSMSSSFWA